MMEVCNGCRDHLQILNMVEEPSSVDCHCKCLYILQTQGKTKADEWPAVAYAARHGHDTCLQAIIQAGADVNTRGKEEYTAVIYAAQFDHPMCLEILLKAGADVNLKKQHGYSALHYACNADSDKKPNHAKCIDSLIQVGADVNSTSFTGITPLMIAVGCTSGDNCVNELIQAGADVNSTSYDGITPLMIAVGCTSGDNCVNALIKAGADVNITDSGLKTALHYVKDVQRLRLLLKAGAHVNMKLTNALKYKILNNHTKDVCMMLFAAGEILAGTTVVITHNTGREKETQVPDYLLFKDVEFRLKHLCREKIRKHLLGLDPHTNLFHRVPQLPLPHIVIDYLLYGLSLESDDDDDDYDDVCKHV